MSQAKALFLANTDVSNQWRGVSKSTAFDNAAVFALSVMAENSPSRELVQGANQIIQILRTIADVETDPTPISSGLEHDLTIPDRSKPKSQEPPKA